MVRALIMLRGNKSYHVLIGFSIKVLILSIFFHCACHQRIGDGHYEGATSGNSRAASNNFNTRYICTMIVKITMVHYVCTQDSSVYRVGMGLMM